MAGNGGIIGPINVTSRGKNTITSKTSSGCFTTQPGSKFIRVAVVGGGAGGNTGNVSNGGGGGGGGGIICQEVTEVIFVEALQFTVLVGPIIPPLPAII